MKPAWRNTPLRKFLMLLATLVFALPPTLGSAAIDPVRIQKLLDEGEPAKARQLVVEGMKADGLAVSASMVANIIGWAYFSSGRYDDAEGELKEALRLAEIDGDSATAKLAANNLGILNFVENRLDESQHYFNRSYNVNTEIAATYRNLIDVKRREIQVSEAIQMGAQKRRERKFDEAVSYYNIALLHDSKNAEALEYKGYALFRLDRYDEAAAILEEARVIDPLRKFLHLNLLKVECARGGEDRVKQVLDQSKLPDGQFAEWFSVDEEFKRVCDKSAEVAKAVGLAGK